MSYTRVRTPGNHPETRIFCDQCDREDDPRERTAPVVGRDAADARRRARSLGWVRHNGRDYCPAHC